MRKLDHGPAAPKIARPSIHPNPSLRFRRTSIAPPTDDSQITQHRIPTLKSDRLLARISHQGQARHRAARSPSRQEKAAARGLGHGQGLRRRARPARRDPKGGGSRPTGRVKALARCASIALHPFPSLSSDIRRAAPVHGEKSGLCPKRPRRKMGASRTAGKAAAWFDPRPTAAKVCRQCRANCSAD